MRTITGILICFVQVFLSEPLPADARVVISGNYFIKSEELKRRE